MFPLVPQGLLPSRRSFFVCYKQCAVAISPYYRCWFSTRRPIRTAPDQAYREGLIYGQTFGRRYKSYFDYYEVGNEEDNQAILGAHVHGNDPGHFETPKAKVIVPYIKGVCQGLRQQDKTAKLIINIVWVHYGFLQRLQDAGVSFDRIGYHWYSDMGTVDKANAGFGNVIDTLYKRFRKPVWVTELNVRGGTSLKTDAGKEGWLRRHLSLLRKNKRVEAVFIYELLDEPAFAEARARASFNVSESAYGLGAWQKKYSGVREKPLFSQYRAFIRKNP